MGRLVVLAVLLFTTFTGNAWSSPDRCSVGKHAQLMDSIPHAPALSPDDSGDQLIADHVNAGLLLFSKQSQRAILVWLGANIDFAIVAQTVRAKDEGSTNVLDSSIGSLFRMKVLLLV